MRHAIYLQVYTTEMDHARGGRGESSVSLVGPGRCAPFDAHVTSNG